jgi:hypothetical protein
MSCTTISEAEREVPAMTLFLLSFAVIVLAILGLGAGVLLGRGPLKGSCGGNAVLRSCPLCRAGED